MSRSDAASPAALCAGATLTIDLGAVQRNYRRLVGELSGAEAAAVVKADGYGLGAARIAPALAKAGARSFFVAAPGEGIDLRNQLAAVAPNAVIYVLNGFATGLGADFRHHRLVPVLNSLGDVDAWRGEAEKADSALPAALQLDTGMSRLGLPATECDRLAADPGLLAGIELRCVMSHLACAEDPADPLNAEQLNAFHAARARLPGAPASFANSSGIFLGADYHFDLVRPGAALYGVNPTPDRSNPMVPVVGLQARVLQVRDIAPPQSVGYGATFQASGPTRVATVAVGYADGYFRSLSNHGRAVVGGIVVPVVGRVSMDLVTLDITAVPEDQVQPGDMADLIPPDGGIDRLAADAGTIGYEVLTALGRRYHRIYVDG